MIPTRGAEIIEVPISSVVFREDLYPRIKKDAETVQKYAADLDVLPPIELNQSNILIDGWNRLTAHKKREATTIHAFITVTTSEAEVLELSIERNATHGLQLSLEDKRDMARRIYHTTPAREREQKKLHLAKILSVSERTLREWLSRIDKDAKDARNKRIFEMWLACHTQEEIAAAVDISRPEVAKTVPNGDFAIWNKSPVQEAAASHLTDFEPMEYNIWRQQVKTPGAAYFGNSEIRWLDNLLKKYTKPFDIVVDPFAGGGSTIGLCKKRFRRYWVSDRKPGVEHAGEIRQHDITTGLPPLPRWQDVTLVYLDPPYWKQAEGWYGKDPTDLSNMPLEQFNETLAGLINGFVKKLYPGATIALLICPTQWNAPGRKIVDHVLDIARMVKLPVERRISVPYESQQANAQMVEWAKANDEWLVLTRELVIWRIPSETEELPRPTDLTPPQPTT